MKGLFIATFAQVESDKFSADTNGTMPYIGTVIGGTAKGSLVNGTIFEMNDYKEKAMYLCQNGTWVDDDGESWVTTEIISEVSTVEFISARKELGKPVNLATAKKEEEVQATA